MINGSIYKVAEFALNYNFCFLCNKYLWCEFILCSRLISRETFGLRIPIIACDYIQYVMRSYFKGRFLEFVYITVW